MSIEIEVTQDDIDKANEIRSSTDFMEYDICAYCPVGLAATRLFGEPVSWGFFDGTLRDKRRLSAVKSDRNAVHAFVNDFDEGRPVRPVTFQAEVAAV